MDDRSWPLAAVRARCLEWPLLVKADVQLAALKKTVASMIEAAN